MSTTKTHEQAHRHEQALRRELGPDVLAALTDDDVVEVMLNTDGRLWLERRSEGLVEAGTRMESGHLHYGRGEAILASVQLRFRPQSRPLLGASRAELRVREGYRKEFGSVSPRETSVPFFE